MKKMGEKSLGLLFVYFALLRATIAPNTTMTMAIDAAAA
jgi:hypothetical protein